MVRIRLPKHEFNLEHSLVLRLWNVGKVYSSGNRKINHKIPMEAGINDTNTSGLLDSPSIESINSTINPQAICQSFHLKTIKTYTYRMLLIRRVVSHVHIIYTLCVCVSDFPALYVVNVLYFRSHKQKICKIKLIRPLFIRRLSKIYIKHRI